MKCDKQIKIQRGNETLIFYLDEQTLEECGHQLIYELGGKLVNVKNMTAAEAMTWINSNSTDDLP